MTVAQALAEARRRGVERLDAQLLLAHAMQRPRAWLIANDEAALTERQATDFAAWLRRRADGEPLAYIVGEKEFHGLTLSVNDKVLVPRPDTETLVDWALELLAGELRDRAAPRIVDLGTGSGAIALALKQECARAHVDAVDISDDALGVARGNAERLGLDVHLLTSHWWSGLPHERFDLAVSNPPYVCAGDPHLAALRHEPTLALSAGPDGLDALRVIVAEAPAHLTPGGWLLLEHGHDQAESVAALLAATGFEQVQSRHDLAGIARCSGGCVAA
ncbi:peptide chain release factor N(5)-glutamine methyltransferase [Piscinibacter sp.]|uniref:peptide chain release factor N(5)-glutamine methyltransferase n=1 Tax=Piscinibacter sp. TaxID=1903157 RepID=UPI002C70B529|nr:peptide chain release factor N(5)-glutamine methyltransferase [Albitalea sp.]HUG24591.1 peptide chain release factor N(5)-glutamine methyltransferase [Albitalea sp.]